MSTYKSRRLSSHIAYWLKAPKAYVDDAPTLGRGQQFGPGYTFSGGKLVEKTTRYWITPVWGLGYQIGSLTITSTGPRKWRGIFDMLGYKVVQGRALQGASKGLLTTFTGTSPQSIREKVSQALKFAYSDLLR